MLAKTVQWLVYVHFEMLPAFTVFLKYLVLILLLTSMVQWPSGNVPAAEVTSDDNRQMQITDLGFLSPRKRIVIHPVYNNLLARMTRTT